MNDDFLKKYYKPPRAAFAADLYRRISQPMQTKPKFLILRRAALASLLLLALLAVTLVVSPPARAFARQLFRQVGVFTLVDLSANPEAAGALAVSPTAQPPSTDAVVMAQDAAEASLLAGFAVYSPDYLPQGYALSGAWSLMEQGSGKVVVSRYQDAGGHFLLINQSRYAAGDHFEQSYAANEQVTDVTVRGGAGVWIEGRLMGDEPAALLPTSWLMWEQDGVNYTLISDALSQKEMLQVAESLK
jgi:hypothetical protein